MTIFDAFISYLYGLKFILIVVMVILCLCGIDDLFIDMYYWLRRFWRRSTVYRRYSRKQATELYEKREQPLAIMVPAVDFKVVDQIF